MVGIAVRVNTRSKLQALFSKKFLEAKIQHPMHIALSSRNYIMLDFDCPQKESACLIEAEAIAKQLSAQFGGKACVYETPHGYHVVHFTWIRWDQVQKILRSLLKGINDGWFKYLDKQHIEACLRRGYMTLRCNQTRKVVCYVNGVKTAF